MKNTPLDRLKHHVTGAIERGEKQAIISAPSNYQPMFLSWCTSYDQEVLELRELVESQPSDEKQLRKDYLELTGKQFRKAK